MTGHDIRFERRMSDAEGVLWQLESDPLLTSTMGVVSRLDRPPDLDRLRRRMDQASRVVGRLRQRPQPVPGGVLPPEWVEDTRFDVSRHVRRITLREGADERAAYEVAIHEYAEPFDRDRPLWDFIAIEGLAGGGALLLQKLHHTVADGEAGIRLSAEFLDLERDGRSAAEVAPVGAAAPVSNPWAAMGDLVARPWQLARQVGGLAAAVARNPAGRQALSSVARQTVVSGRALSPLWRTRSASHGFEPLQLPFARTKEAAHALGGTVNDLYVSGLAAALGEHHRRRGAAVEELRMAMPVSTRTDGAAANSFSPARVLVPVGELAPRERFALVHERLGAARHEPGLPLVQTVAGLIGLLPPPLVARFARSQVGTVDFTASNLRGAPFELYTAGAKLLANHPVGPLGGTAVNATVMSYAGSLDIGLHVDRAAVDDPAELGRLVTSAFEDLFRVAGV